MPGRKGLEFLELGKGGERHACEGAMVCHRTNEILPFPPGTGVAIKECPSLPTPTVGGPDQRQLLYAHARHARFSVLPRSLPCVSEEF